jgi:hypothetical protein
MSDLNRSLTVNLVNRVYSGLPFELFPENLTMYIGKKRIGLRTIRCFSIPSSQLRPSR